MNPAFPRPYVDTAITSREPYSQVSTAVRPNGPRDSGPDRAYMQDRAAVTRSLSFSPQAKPPQLLTQFKVGSDPYKG